MLPVAVVVVDGTVVVTVVSSVVVGPNIKYNEIHVSDFPFCLCLFICSYPLECLSVSLGILTQSYAK